MYAILDIETTGGKFNEEGITEIAIYRFDGQHVVDSFVSLVNPERPIQEFVKRLTGIHSKMLVNAPKFHEVAKRIIEITKDCVLVAHNTSFDYRILSTEYRRLGYVFERNTLCTVELSKKLIEGEASYSLGKLCKSLGIPMSNRHRADGDALATVQLFKILLQKDTDKCILKSTIKTIIPKKEIAQKLHNIIAKIPNGNGVFYMHQTDGQIIYIGKANNLKKEVNQLFLRTSKKMKKLQEYVVEVSYEKTGNNLITLLKYFQELQLNKPKFNTKERSKAIETTFSNPNMIVIDKGRDVGEKSVVLIENNQLKGFGFIDLSYQINNLEILHSLINPLENSIENKFIVNNYLQKRKVEKIIRF